MTQKDAEYSEAEIAHRRDEAIRRALRTPPKPMKAYIGKSVRIPKSKERATPAKKGSR